MIDINNLSVQFTGSNLFEGVNLKIQPTDKIALVGSNGTGKSTFLKIISGKQKQEDGSLQFKKGLKVGYLPQELNSSSTNTIFKDVKKSISAINLIEQEETKLNANLANENLSQEEHNNLILKIGELNLKKEEIGYYEIDSMIEKILMGLGFSVDSFNKKTSELSGGWQMRVELAKILISNNDIILLDEPTNHLDIDSLRWLIKFLKSFPGAIILVSHDRYFVNMICNKTLEIYNRNVNFYKGRYDDYLNYKHERDERLKLEYQDQQKKIKQTEQFIERFRYKATKAKQVQSRVKQLEKIDRIQLTDNESKIHFKFFDTVKSGILPIKVTNLSKSYGDNEVLTNINLQIEREDKIALVGPNGAGKTTLAKLLSERIKPTDGSVEFGHNTQISFYAQDVVDNLNLKNDIITELYESDSENSIGYLRTILGAFLFNGEEVFKKIEVLSGGEKSRVGLAKVLLNKANTIILDEPTNHLDYDSKKMVQNALKKFKGTLIIVSHDIDFLEPIVNKVLEVKNNSIKEYPGGIDYYLLKRDEFENLDQNAKSFEVKEKKISRKEEKRIEAEKRKQEHLATADLKKEIINLEKKIEDLESIKSKLELDLTNEEVYSNPILAKENKIEYDEVKSELESIYTKWAESQEMLEEVMANLSS